MFSNQSNQQLPANRGPLQPCNAMQSTGRYYNVEVYGHKPNGKRYHLTVVQWSADAQASQLPRRFSTTGESVTVNARRLEEKGGE